MIKYKKGDLLQAPENIIAHGCNAVGGFGSGVAGQIAKEFPHVKQAYLCAFEDMKLGDIQYCPINECQYIVNCITQQEYLPRGKCHADYDAIEKSLRTIKWFAKNNNLSIAIPKIGCGLAGGDWEVVSEILEDIFHDYEITVYEK